MAAAVAVADKNGFRVADDPDKTKCWMRVKDNKYLGKVTEVKYIGHPMDLSVDITFETGDKIEYAEYHKFKEVPCPPPSPQVGGRRRRTGKRKTRSRRHTRRRR